jgi:HAD superfamily hydrolase (TIGR01509 family)
VIVAFDVMDTLVVDPFYDALPAFFSMTFEEFLAAKHPRNWLEFETARIDEATYLRTLFRDRRPVDGAALRCHLARSYRWVDGMEALLAELCDRGIELHAMSNYPVWYHLIEEELGLSRYLQWSLVSWDTGLRKPDPMAYRRGAARLGARPEQLLLVDDQARNVDAARSEGWDGVHFVDAPSLRRELEARGIL